MKAIEFYLPSVEKDDFTKFVNKTKKYVPGLTVEFGEEESKMFSHPVIVPDDEGRRCLTSERQWHKVYHTTVTLPDENGWRLLATIEDGAMYVADTKQGLNLSNKAHGLDYNVCDVCGHSLMNSYIVSNIKTGEELQVGCGCVKKFGLKMMKYIAEFCKEINRVIDLYGCAGGYEEEDFIGSWEGRPDKEAFAAIETTTLLKAAVAYYKDHKEWIKGYYDEYRYYKSESSIAIRLNVEQGNLEGEDSYIAKIIEHCKAMKANSEFVEDMQTLANSFYSCVADAAKAYFMVKSYEEYLEKQRLNLQPLVKGMQVKVEGEVVASNGYENYYGYTTEYKIKTDKGYTVYRSGVIPITERNGKKTTSFFALVKFVGQRKIILDRALKNPKKGLEIVCL